MDRKQFTFYESFYKAMADMGMLKRGIAITLICDYALYGTEPPQCDGKLKMFMDLVYPNLAAGRKKALAGQSGAGVTNQKRKGKIEKEKELENELEIELERECVSRAGFERFWDLYPMKIGEADAWEIWQQKKPDPEMVCQKLRQWMSSKQWCKDGSAFIPRAAKFLEQAYYLQAPEAETGATGRLGQAELEALALFMKEN